MDPEVDEIIIFGKVSVGMRDPVVDENGGPRSELVDIVVDHVAAGPGDHEAEFSECVRAGFEPGAFFLPIDRRVLGNDVFHPGTKRLFDLIDHETARKIVLQYFLTRMKYRKSLTISFFVL